MFKFVYDISGSNRCLTVDLPIDKATKVERGQIVKISAGKVVCASAGSFAGIANETHTGEYDAFNLRNDKELINVAISPGSVYAVDCPTVEFAVVSSDARTAIFPGSANYDENDVSGGQLIFIAKGASSENTDNIGSSRKITGYNKASKSMTLSDGGKIGVGDKYAFVPPVGFKKLAADANCSNVKLSDTSGSFAVVSSDLLHNQIHVVLTDSQII